MSHETCLLIIGQFFLGLLALWSVAVFLLWVLARIEFRSERNYSVQSAESVLAERMKGYFLFKESCVDLQPSVFSKFDDEVMTIEAEVGKRIRAMGELEETPSNLVMLVFGTGHPFRAHYSVINRESERIFCVAATLALSRMTADPDPAVAVS